MLSLIGLIAAITLLIYFSLRGLSLFLTTPLCAIIIAVTGDITLISADGSEDLVKAYTAGFATFFRNWFFMFLLGSLFGKLMETSGAAHSLSHWIVSKFGHKYAVFSVVAMCAILTYGGVSVFIVAFSVYPMAASLFRDAKIPHRFLPATLAFGSVTFTMTSAGSPEIQNWIPIKYLGTSPFAAWEVSLIVAIFMAVTGFLWLQYMIKKARLRNEDLGLISNEEQLFSQQDHEKLPHPIIGFIPLVIVLLTSVLTHATLRENALSVALLAGCATLGITNFQRIKQTQSIMDQSAYGALMAIGNTSAVVGFGAVAILSPAFEGIVAILTNMDGNQLIGAALAITTVAGITGSASGGQTIALPELAPHYLEAGTNPEHLHRITAISSGMLDSLPHSGYVVTTIREICKETHKSAYLPLGAVTAVIPMLGLILAIALIQLGL